MVVDLPVYVSKVSVGREQFRRIACGTWERDDRVEPEEEVLNV